MPDEILHVPHPMSSDLGTVYCIRVHNVEELPNEVLPSKSVNAMKMFI